MLQPMTILMHQRARIGILVLSLVQHKGELQALKNLIEEVVNQLKAEQSGLQNRKVILYPFTIIMDYFLILD